MPENDTHFGDGVSERLRFSCITIVRDHGFTAQLDDHVDERAEILDDIA